jgi:hypothetical protein
LFLFIGSELSRGSRSAELLEAPLAMMMGAVATTPALLVMAVVMAVVTAMVVVVKAS